LPPGPDPFTTATARRLGFTDAAMRHAIRSGRWDRLSRGVYVQRSPTSSSTFERERELLLRDGLAATLASRGAVLSHSAAAAWHGLPTLRAGRRPCVTVTPETPSHVARLAHLHRAALAPDDVDCAGEVRLTAIPRTVLGIAREHGVEAAVVAGDAALSAGRTSTGELYPALERQHNWPGRSVAARAVALLRTGSESPLESRSRLRILAHGLPEPILQQQIGDGDGTFLGRVDFCWDEYGVIGEADGQLKYGETPATVKAAVLAEKQRQSRLLETGLIVIRWDWSDLARFERVAARLRSAFARGIRRGARREWSLPT
jgi:hypothetical protein